MPVVMRPTVDHNVEPLSRFRKVLMFVVTVCQCQERRCSRDSTAELHAKQAKAWFAQQQMTRDSR